MQLQRGPELRTYLIVEFSHETENSLRYESYRGNCDHYYPISILIRRGRGIRQYALTWKNNYKWKIGILDHSAVMAATG